jgi:phage terminase Nu1 subunit (DNA packaging protein)
VRERALGALANLDLQEREGRLVEADRIVAKWSDHVVAAKTKILAIPSSLKQRHPDLALEVLATLDAAIREALSELAAGEDRRPAHGR